jgi:hypothetical protein
MKQEYEKPELVVYEELKDVTAAWECTPSNPCEAE